MGGGAAGDESIAIVVIDMLLAGRGIQDQIPGSLGGGGEILPTV
jgi:hypothetical protein